MDSIIYLLRKISYFLDVADSLNTPLYRCLASALHEYISCVASCGTFNNIGPLNEDDGWKKREGWNDLILKEGSEIVKVCISVFILLFQALLLLYQCL